MADNTREEAKYSSYQLSAQQSTPTCAGAPPSCTLDFLDYDVTNVTVRGAADGEILITFEGVTGATTSCYINGVLDGTSSTDEYTFTGVTAGYYNILIEDGDCFDTSPSILVRDGEFRSGDFTTNEPASFTASENPIILNLKTAVNSGTPSQSKGTITVSSTISDGDSIVFNLNYPQEYDATFYAKEFPNRTSYFLASTLRNAAGVSAGSNSATEIATSIAEVLNSDTVISRLYWITSSGAVVYLSAKENNQKLDIDTVVTATGNLTVTQTQNGNATYDGAIVENYSLYLDLFIDPNLQYGEDPDNGTFNKYAQLELPFNPINNQHYFDLSNVLKNTVSTPKIDFTITGYTTIASMLSAYQVKYGEKYPLVSNSSTKKSRVKGSVDTKYVLNSALAWEDENDLSAYLGTEIHDVTSNFTLSGDYSAGSDELSISVEDYLIDSGHTTDIKFRYVRTGSILTEDSGWITGTTYALTPPVDVGYGSVYISGVTSGITFNFSKTWLSYGTSETFTYQTYADDFALHEIEWLTNSPSPKFVQRNSSEFLYLLIPKDFGNELKVKGDLYFYDGTILTGETLYTVSTGTTNWGGVFMFAAGYNELGLADYETYSGGTRKIRKVDIALYQNDGINADYLLSTEKSYRYEIDEASNRYGVAFLNKLGTYDIFDFAGEIVNSVTHSNETYEVPREIALGGNSPNGFQATTVYDTKVTKTIAANSGWINLETFNWLIELIESNRCYNYTETDQSFLVAGTPTYTKSTNDDLYQIDVTFTETLYQNSVSV